MPKKATQVVTAPEAQTETQVVTAPELTEAQAEIARLKQELADANKAKEDAEIAKLEADQAAAIKGREDKTPVIPEDDKKVLDMLAEGRKAELVADKLGLEVVEVIEIAYQYMNNESIYQLAERLGVKANDVYKATNQPDMVRYVQVVDDNGKRSLQELDYEAV